MIRNKFLFNNAGWSSLVARQAHNLKVVGSNPTPATKYLFKISAVCYIFFLKWNFILNNKTNIDLIYLVCQKLKYLKVIV